MLKRLFNFKLRKHELAAETPTILPAPPEEPDSVEIAIAPAVRKLVLAIVSNPARNDSRVLKQAKSLSESGYDVLILAASGPDLPKEETNMGVRFRRFPMFDIDVKLPPALMETAIKLFGSEANLIREKFTAVVRDKALADEADLVFQEARRFARSLSSMDVRKAGAKESLEQAKILRKEAAVAFKATYKAHFIYIKHYLFTLNCLAHGIIEKPSIIHSHDLYPLAAATHFARQTGAKVVYDAHELEVERMPVMDDEEKRFIQSIEDHLIAKCDGMATVCKSIGDIYEKRTGKTPAVIYNSPDTRVSVETTFNLRHATGLDATVPIIAYTGNVGREGRGLHLVVEAMTQLPDFNLAIIGPRHLGNDAWLTGVAEKHGVSKRLHLIPPVNPDQVVHATKAASVGVCPIQDASLSYRLSMPNKLFEMALSGIPIAASNLPEMGKFVSETGIGMLMDQEDPSSIAKTILELHNNRQRYLLDDKGMAELIVQYCWQAQERKLLSLYDVVMGN